MNLIFLSEHHFLKVSDLNSEPASDLMWLMLLILLSLVGILDVNNSIPSMQASVARTLETRYQLLDPRTMGDDPDYTKYGPYAICASLQEEHGKLIADSDLPALANKLPETNNVSPEEKDDKEKNIQCYKCKQWGHKANDPIFPLFNRKLPSRQPSDQSSDRRMKAKDPWKYVEPKDLTQPVTIDDKK